MEKTFKLTTPKERILKAIKDLDNHYYVLREKNKENFLLQLNNNTREYWIAYTGLFNLALKFKTKKDAKKVKKMLKLKRFNIVVCK